MLGPPMTVTFEHGEGLLSEESSKTFHRQAATLSTRAASRRSFAWPPRMTTRSRQCLAVRGRGVFVASGRRLWRRQACNRDAVGAKQPSRGDRPSLSPMAEWCWWRNGWRRQPQAVLFRTEWRPWKMIHPYGADKTPSTVAVEARQHEVGQEPLRVSKRESETSS